jgi:hypothetical protein
VSITGTLIIQMIVFLILVGFTMKFVWPPITAALDERAKKIADGLRPPTRPRPNWPPPTSAWKQSWPSARDDAARLADAERRAQPWSKKPRAAPAKKAPRSSPPPAPKPSRNRQGPRGPARAGGRAGRQGRRADPAQGSQRRRARRAAGPPESGALTMAELATIARPYAEALFKSVGGSAPRR